MMAQEAHPKTTAGTVFVYVLAYAGWIMTTLLGLVTVFYTRQVLDMLWRALGVRAGLAPIAVNLRVVLYDRVGTLILLLLWAGFAFFTEHHYRSSVDAARWRQFKEEPVRSRQDTPARSSRLRKWGIDILIRRFIGTISIPIFLLGLAYLIGRITLWSF